MPKYDQPKDNVFTPNLMLYQEHSILGQYKGRATNLKGSNHNGQIKLFLSEVLFLNRYVIPTIQRDKLENPIVVYAGSAAGHHIPILSTMFPEVKFKLYDPSPFAISETDRISITQRIFTDADIEELKSKYENIFLISDIRSPITTGALMINNEIMIMRDMYLQKEWHHKLKPIYGFYKFRSPFAYKYDTPVLLDRYIMYLDGDLYFQCFNNDGSTEMRLVAPRDAKDVGYDIERIDDVMAYQNFHVRRYYTYRNPIIHFFPDDPKAKRREYSSLPLYTRARIRRKLIDGEVDPTAVDFINSREGRGYDDMYALTVLIEYFINRGMNSPKTILELCNKVLHKAMDDIESFTLHDNHTRISTRHNKLAVDIVPFDKPLEVGFEIAERIESSREQFNIKCKQLLKCVPTKNAFTRLIYSLLSENSLTQWYKGEATVDYSDYGLRQLINALLPFAMTLNNDVKSDIPSIFNYIKRNESLLEDYIINNSLTDAQITLLAIQLFYKQYKAFNFQISGDNLELLVKLSAVDVNNPDDVEGTAEGYLNLLNQLIENSRLGDLEPIYSNVDKVNQLTVKLLNQNIRRNGSPNMIIHESRNGMFKIFKVFWGDVRKQARITKRYYEHFIDDKLYPGTNNELIAAKLLIDSEINNKHSIGFIRSHRIETINTILNITHGDNYQQLELYGDMFNSFTRGYCSAMPELEYPYGSIGRVEQVLEKIPTITASSITIQANPPYVNAIYRQFANLVNSIMDTKTPITIILTYPRFDDKTVESLELIQQYKTQEVEADSGKSYYIAGGKEIDFVHINGYEIDIKIVAYQNDAAKELMDFDIVKVAESMAIES